MRYLLVALAMAGSSAAAQQHDNAPLSAIDWLSESVALPEKPAREVEAPVTQSASAPTVTVTALDSPTPDATGILPPSITGLPRDLWSGSLTDDLATQLRSHPRHTLPALIDFLTMLMLAEADAPIDAGLEGKLLQVRIDTLLGIGAIEPALSLLEAASPETPALFQRYFDIGLLTGTEDDGCRVMQERPSIAPTATARIFCLARSGDWNAAALTLNTHRILGDMTEEEDLLLTLFLDAEFADGADALPRPSHVTPLIYRMREAIGDPLPTARLALAFAYADLRSNIGWKTQLDAAERLAKAGALPASQLQDVYTSRRRSASGGVWERVEAFQEFEEALKARDANELAETLPDAWDAMVAIKAEVPFASLFAEDLSAMSLNSGAADLAARIGLLSKDYELAAGDTALVDPFLAALARGVPQEQGTTDPDRLAVQAAFNGAIPPTDLMAMAQNGQIGAALLKGLALVQRGIDGDRNALTRGLAFLRAAGLEDLARRVALQFLILERQR